MKFGSAIDGVDSGRLKVIIVLGSPRKEGNGARIAEMVGQELKKKGDFDIELVHLSDLALLQCKGCFTCVSKGEDKCPLRDGRADLEDRMLAADGLVLISPGYVQNVSGLMKNFIDRFCYTNHRPTFHHQSAIIVANGGSGLKHVLRALRVSLGGMRVVDEVAVLTPPWPVGDKVRAKNDRAIERASDKLHRDMIRKGPSPVPSFSEYMRFRFFKEISPNMGAYLPADKEFYSDKGDFYYEVKIGVAKRIAAAIVLKVGLALSKEMGPAE